MKIRYDFIDGALVITPLASHFDADLAIEMKDKTIALHREGVDSILVDLQNVTHLDNSALAAFISIMKRLDNDGQLALCSVSSTIGILLKLTRVDQIITSYSNRNSALIELLANTGIASRDCPAEQESVAQQPAYS